MLTTQYKYIQRERGRERQRQRQIDRQINSYRSFPINVSVILHLATICPRKSGRCPGQVLPLSEVTLVPVCTSLFEAPPRGIWFYMFAIAIGLGVLEQQCCVCISSTELEQSLQNLIRILWRLCQHNSCQEGSTSKPAKETVPKWFNHFQQGRNAVRRHVISTTPLTEGSKAKIQHQNDGSCHVSLRKLPFFK